MRTQARDCGISGARFVEKARHCMNSFACKYQIFESFFQQHQRLTDISSQRVRISTLTPKPANFSRLDGLSSIKPICSITYIVPTWLQVTIKIETPYTPLIDGDDEFGVQPEPSTGRDCFRPWWRQLKNKAALVHAAYEQGTGV